MFELIDFNDLKSFIIEHNLISYSVSWVVAVAFTLFIQSAVGDILLPTIYFTFRAIKGGLGFPDKEDTVDSIFEKVHKINIANFLKETISLFLILLVLYVLIRDIINNWVRDTSSNSLFNTNLTKPISTNPVSTTEKNTTITQQPYYFSTSTGSSSSSG